MFMSLLTDYGLRDGFVASCHGAVLRVVPDARILDITHLIEPQDIRRGAAVLAQTVPDLPVGVHVAVVDPGVGTSRRPIAIAVARGDVLVGPDNGVLTDAADALGGIVAAVQITPRDDHNGTVTFDGRDVFAPAAARLLTGMRVDELGPAVTLSSLQRLPAPVVAVGNGAIRTEVLTVDRFGNIQLAAQRADADAAGLQPGMTLHVTIAEETLALPLAKTFADVAVGEAVLLSDSAGHLAIAIRDGNAADHFGTAPGDRVRLRT